MKLIKLPQALIDLVETADYFAENSPETADRFFDAFEATLNDILKTPKIGSIRKFRNDVDIRMWFVRGFKRSLIFYTENNDEVVILRIIDSAREYTRFFNKD